MKVSKNINASMNQVLAQHLISINQYFLHARILKNWGFETLGKHVYKASIQSMKSADDMIERILFLEGLPNLQQLGKLNIGESVPEIIKADFNLETAVRQSILAAICLCENESDFVSRDLLSEILEESEEWIDFLEMQLELIQGMGVENYLQSATAAVAKSE